MGSFAAHILTGIYAISVGLWWMYNAACRYVAFRKLNLPFHSSCWYIWIRYPNFPLEAWTSCILGFIEISGELATGWDVEGFVWTNAQHMIMFGMLSMFGISQLLQFYRIWVVPGTDYLLYLLTLFISGFLLTHHTHGHESVDILIHHLILYPLIGLFFSTMLQFFRSDLPIIAMARAMFAVHFGLNWLHSGFILFPPWGVTWELNSHRSTLNVTVIFGFELVLSALLILIMTSVVQMFYSNDIGYLKKVTQPQPFEIQTEKHEPFHTGSFDGSHWTSTGTDKNGLTKATV